MTKTAWVFPGQGAQSVGMGRDLYDNIAAARSVFEQADAAAGFALSRLCFEGPEEELRQTINTQPALVAVSLACLEATRSINGHNLPAPAFVAGHSLGEYTALAVAGVFDTPTAVRLARERGRLMHEAGKVRAGAMTAIMGLDEAVIAEIGRETDTCLANINCPGQIVISGAAENVARAMEMAKSKGAARITALKVSGAFHSPLMQPAVEGMEKFTAAITFQKPSIPVIANTTARPLTAAEAIRPELLNQLRNPVQWQRSIEYMTANGVDTFIEIGPGKVLTGLIKRISPEAKLINLSNLETIKSLGNP